MTTVEKTKEKKEINYKVQYILVSLLSISWIK